MIWRIVVSLVVLGALALGAGATSSSSSSSHSSLASWYGPGLYGNPLACGGRLWPSTWGVAHRSLPCGTLVTVCLSRCASARVVDRGPFVGGRVLDLTAAFARYVGLSGVRWVRWWGRVNVRRLQTNPDPLRIVPQAQRDAWTKQPAYKSRCDHEDGRGRCTSRETTARWRPDLRLVEHFCDRHADEAQS